MKEQRRFIVFAGLAALSGSMAVNVVYQFTRVKEPTQALPVIVAAMLTAGLIITCLVAYIMWLQAHRWSKLSQVERDDILRARDEAREDAALYKAIEREARYLVKEIPNHLSVQNKLDHKPTHEEHRGRRGRRKKRLVKFDAVLITKTEIWFHFNGRKLPYGVSFSDLRDPQHRVRENLQYAIHRPCRFFEDYEFNLFLRVGLKNSVMGVPKKVKWSRIYPALPKSNSFAVAMGVNEYGKLIYQDLRNWPHGIVAGSTNQGKSTQLNQWITTLIKRNSPDMCQFVFVDLKDGVEFGRFKNLPHTLAFVDEPADVLAQLKWLHSEYKKRMSKFKGVCQNIKGWNGQKRNKLPYIFMVIDELAVLTLDRELSGPAVDVMVKLAQRARAAGIHLIVATQILQAEVLPLLIRGNFPGRVVFSVPGNTESILILNNSMAAGMEPQGRCVYLHGARHHVLQAPIANDEEIDTVIQDAVIGKQPDAAPFNEMDLFKVALHNLGGLASWRELYDSIDGAMGQKRIKDTLKNYSYDFDDPAASVIDLDGETYILSHPVLGPGGNKPRRLVAVNGHFPTTREELTEMAWGQGAGVKENIPSPPPLDEINESVEIAIEEVEESINEMDEITQDLEEHYA